MTGSPEASTHSKNSEKHRVIKSHRHKLANWHVSMISVGGVIGAGLFVGTSATIAAAGPAVLLSYLGAGFIVWFVMMTMGELSAYYNIRGSFISHISKTLGKRCGFVSGWSYIFLWVVTAGAQAVAGGMILNDLFNITPLIGSLGLIVLALLLNALPVRLYGQSEALLSVLKLLTLALFMGIALYWVWHQTNAKAQITSHLFDHGGLVPFGIWSVFTVIPMIIQTFTGCEIAFVASPESTDPKDNIKQAVNRIPFIILIFYVGSILAILCLHPWTDIISGHSPFLLVMRSLSVPFAQTIVIIMTLMAIISCLNSSKYIVSRVLRELSELGCAPAQLNQSTRHNVPITALILSTSLEIIIILIASFSPSRGYAILLGASGNLIIFSYFMASLSRSSLSKYIARPLMSFLARISVLFMGGLLVILPFSSSTRLEGIIALCLIASLSVASLKLSRN